MRGLPIPSTLELWPGDILVLRDKMSGVVVAEITCEARRIVRLQLIHR